MDNKLKKIVLNKIKEIYPEISTKDIIVLLGSRAKDFFIKDSDIDTIIFTNNYNYFKRISVKKGLRKSSEDAGFEIKIENGLLLETKIYPLKIPKFDVMFYYDILSAQALTSINSFKIFQNKIQKKFMKNYERYYLILMFIFLMSLKILKESRSERINYLKLTYQ